MLRKRTSNSINFIVLLFVFSLFSLFLSLFCYFVSALIVFSVANGLAQLFFFFYTHTRFEQQIFSCFPRDWIYFRFQKFINFFKFTFTSKAYSTVSRFFVCVFLTNLFFHFIIVVASSKQNRNNQLEHRLGNRGSNAITNKYTSISTNRSSIYFSFAIFKMNNSNISSN